MIRIAGKIYFYSHYTFYSLIHRTKLHYFKGIIKYFKNLFL